MTKLVIVYSNLIWAKKFFKSVVDALPPHSIYSNTRMFASNERCILRMLDIKRLNSFEGVKYDRIYLDYGLNANHIERVVEVLNGGSWHEVWMVDNLSGLTKRGQKPAESFYIELLQQNMVEIDSFLNQLRDSTNDKEELCESTTTKLV